MHVGVRVLGWTKRRATCWSALAWAGSCRSCPATCIRKLTALWKTPARSRLSYGGIQPSTTGGACLIEKFSVFCAPPKFYVFCAPPASCYRVQGAHFPTSQCDACTVTLARVRASACSRLERSPAKGTQRRKWLELETHNRLELPSRCCAVALYHLYRMLLHGGIVPPVPDAVVSGFAHVWGGRGCVLSVLVMVRMVQYGFGWCSMHWSDLHRMLYDACPPGVIHMGHTVTRFHKVSEGDRMQVEVSLPPGAGLVSEGTDSTGPEGPPGGQEDCREGFPQSAERSSGESPALCSEENTCVILLHEEAC